MPTEIEVYQSFRDYIKHEDQLINYRMTWMLTIHGFLYATFGFTLQKILEIAEKKASFLANNYDKTAMITAYTESPSLENAFFEAKVFLICICLVGMGISLTALFSIRSAYKAVESVRDIFEAFRRSSDFEELPPGVTRLRVYRMPFGKYSRIGLPLITGGGRPSGAASGFIVAKLIPVVLIISWIVSIFFVCIDINLTTQLTH